MFGKSKNQSDKHKIMRLNSLCVWDLINFAEKLGIPLDEQRAELYCNNAANTITYGFYINTDLVAIMVASLLLVFPESDLPNGREIYISGQYILPEYEDFVVGERTIKDHLLGIIEDDAKYLSADGVFLNGDGDGYQKIEMQKKLFTIGKEKENVL